MQAPYSPSFDDQPQNTAAAVFSSFMESSPSFFPPTTPQNVRQNKRLLKDYCQKIGGRPKDYKKMLEISSACHLG